MSLSSLKYSLEEQPRMAERLYYNDVWASADGKEWERLLEHAPWDPRSCATLPLRLSRMRGAESF